MRTLRVPRYVVVFAVTASVLVGGTASASPSEAAEVPSCRLASGVLRVQLDGSPATIRASRGSIRVSGQRCSGDPTTSSVSSIVVTGSPIADALTISMAGGALQPGAAPESEGVSEIELSIDLSGGADVLALVGSARSDRYRIGAAGVGLNGDQDVDVTFAGVESMSVRTLDGADVISGAGTTSADVPTLLPLTVAAGAGGDTATGGAGDDRLFGDGGPDVLRGRTGGDALAGGRGSGDLCEGGGQPSDTFDVPTCEVIPAQAHPDSAPAVADGPAVEISPLANDSGAGPLTVIATDDTGTTGSVVDNGDGTIAYSPKGALPWLAEGMEGTDTFDYTMTGANAPAPSSASVVVTVTGVNDTPVAEDDAASTDQASKTTVDPLQNDADPDIDAGLTIVSVDQPDAGGSVDLVEGGAALDFDPGTAFDELGAGRARQTTFEYAVEDDHGAQDTATVTITVTGLDDAPTASDDAATVAEDAQPTSIPVLVNDRDVDGDPVTISSAGDPDHGTAVLSGGTTGRHTQLRYAPDADYCTGAGRLDSFEYTVTGGGTATVTIDVTCTDDAPVAVDDVWTVDEDHPSAAIRVLDNDTDVDGGPIAIRTVTQPAHGSAAIVDDEVVYVPDADYCSSPEGADTFAYTLDRGGSATVSVHVTCVEDASVAHDDVGVTGEDFRPKTILVLANDVDADGEPILVASATDPVHGAVALLDGVDGGYTRLTYEPDPGYCNDPPGDDPDTFDYTITGGDTATVSMTVACVDDPPVAVDDSFTVLEDDPASALAVLSNDTDVDGGPRAIATATQPANGTVVLTGGSACQHTGLTYAPNPDHCSAAPDTFTYELDGGSTATVSVDVACVDDAPVGVSDAASLAEDASATAIAVLTNDTDIDGGPRTIATTTQPANGAVVLSGGTAGAYTVLTYAPSPDYCNAGAGGAPDTFAYTLTGGSVATVGVTVTCVDDFAIAVGDTVAMAEDASTASLNVLTNDTDVDGGPKTIASVTQAGHGTVALTGGVSGAHTGLTYRPTADYCNDPPGTTLDAFTYTLTGGSSATVSVRVICVDDRPDANEDYDTVREDSGPTLIDVLANDVDVDGGSGPIVITSYAGPNHGTLAPTGGAEGAYTGLMYTPDPNYCSVPPSTDNFVYTVTGGDKAKVYVAVKCLDDDPTAVDDAVAVAEDAPATPIDVLANDTDVDGGTKVITSVTQPAHGTVVPTGPVGEYTGLTYRPEPDYCNAGGSSPYVPLVIFTGESNSGGYALNTAATADELAPTSAVQILDNYDLDAWEDLDVGENNLIGHTGLSNGSTHGWELGLANSVEAGEWWSDTVYLVKAGQGGSLISEWDEGDLYWETFQRRVEAAVSLLEAEGKIPIISVWYSIGINDALSGTNEATWLAAVQDEHARIRDTLGVVPIFMTTFMEESAGSSYNDSIESYAAADPMVWTVDGTDASLRDVHHWDYSGMQLLASRFVDLSLGVASVPDTSVPDRFTYAVNGGDEATVSVTVTCVDDPAPG